MNSIQKTPQLLFAALGGSVMLVSCTSLGKEADAGEKPLNIIYIMSDDHTQQAISAYSDRYGITTTPNIDKIADEGLIFRNSFVANSISGPSRACLLTGKHSHKNGFMNNENQFDGSQQTMPKLLQNAGYQTAMIGKWHLHSDPTGFDYWDILPGQGDYYSPVMYTKDKRTTYPGVYVTDLITDKSINWLETRNREKPFCLFVHHKAVHRNFMGNVYSDLTAYEDMDFPIPDNFHDDYEGRKAAQGQEMTIANHYSWEYDLKVKSTDGTPAIHKFGGYDRMNESEKAVWDSVYNPVQREINAKNLQGKALAEWKYQRYIKDYLKTAKAMDESIGKLMDYLEKNNLLENTLIIYTSDQGFYMGEHGWYDKRFMYEESFSTPLIMLLPKRFKAKGDVQEFVQNIDHAPTFLEIAGAEIPNDIQGVSYLPILKGKHPKSWRKSLYYHFYEFPGEHAVRRHYGIRTERYKLIHFYHDIDTWELYDLKNDPSEMKNLINDPKQVGNIKSLKKQLWDLQVKYDDPIRLQYPI